MAVEIKYDANQRYQRDAIDSVVELFAGQDGGLDFNQTVFGNALSLSSETLQANLRRVQDKPVVQQDGSTRPSIPEADRRAFGESALDFSVEMETGTGKTYVYIRTIAELHQKYGCTKFVIVVPSVAIREGVIASLGNAQGPHRRALRRSAVHALSLQQCEARAASVQFATALGPADHGHQHRCVRNGEDDHEQAG